MTGLGRHHTVPSNGHEHEWHVDEGQDLIYEDGAVFLHEECEYVEIIDSQTSARHDETFYETGYECEATKTYRFDLVTIEKLHGMTDAHESIETVCAGREAILSLYDENPILVEEIEQRAAETLCGGNNPEALDWCWHRVDTANHEITVEYNGDTYRLEYEHTDTMEDAL